MSPVGPRVVVVEDDPDLRTLLARGLEEEGFEAAAVGTGAALLDEVSRAAPDVLVVDVGLPDGDGRDVCQALRARGIDVPVLFLTARDALVDRLAGFDAGGDDYVTKPFAFAELVARLQALLRRVGADGAVERDGMRLDPVTHAVASNGREVSLMSLASSESPSAMVPVTVASADFNAGLPSGANAVRSRVPAPGA